MHLQFVHKLLYNISDCEKNWRTSSTIYTETFLQRSAHRTALLPIAFYKTSIYKNLAIWRTHNLFALRKALIRCAK